MAKATNPIHEGINPQSTRAKYVQISHMPKRLRNWTLHAHHIPGDCAHNPFPLPFASRLIIATNTNKNNCKHHVTILPV